jgi:glycosyltransferase involved in cell wall biosynthesis
LGRIDRKKGIDQLIGSFAALANEYPYLDLVVAGPDRTGLSDSLKALAQHLNVADRIHWPGMLMGHEKWGAFRHCRIFALTSHQENFGVVLSEALSVAKPVLITRNVNIWREIEQDAAGIVVDDTPEDVETGLRRMVAMNADSFIGMCKAARHCFESRYDLATHSPKTIRILQTYLSEPFS